MRLLISLVVVLLSSSSCLPMVVALPFALSPAGAAQRAHEGRIREAAYRKQLEVDATAARARYNEVMRDAQSPEPVLATAPQTPTTPPLLTSEPPRKPLAPVPCVAH